MLVDFFNFNTSLSMLIATNLRKIESTLSTSIVKVLMEKIDLLHDGRTIFACLSKQGKYSFFKDGLEHNDNKKIDELFSELQANFAKLRKSEQSLKKNWLKWEEGRLYSLVLVYPFAVNIDLFCNLKVEFQDQILKRGFLQIKILAL